MNNTNMKAKFGYGPYGTFSVTLPNGKILYFGNECEAIEYFKNYNKQN